MPFDRGRQDSEHLSALVDCQSTDVTQLNNRLFRSSIVANRCNAYDATPSSVAEEMSAVLGGHTPFINQAHIRIVHLRRRMQCMVKVLPRR